MANQVQGGNALVTRTLAYDNPSYVTRQSAPLAAVTAGAAGTSTKFYAWTQLVVFGATFCTVTAGTSTYTVNGSATTAATQYSLLYVTNTNTTGTAVTLSTTTVGPFTIGGTSTAGTNVSVGGTSGGIAGGYQGPFAFNTLGGTTTTQAWGATTFTASPAGGNNFGQGGLPMNPGDTLQFVSGTDATASLVPIIQYAIQAPTGAVVA